MIRCTTASTAYVILCVFVLHIRNEIFMPVEATILHFDTL
jgi:hypothetical protein